MNPAELGQKLKEARLSKKLTQQDVVGNFITRNMLSQIESGTAIPSMKTLDYLSRTLDIPLSSLLSDTDYDNDPHENMRTRVSAYAKLLIDAKSHIISKDYKAAIDVLENDCDNTDNPFSDEFHALLSKSCLEYCISLTHADKDNPSDINEACTDNFSDISELSNAIPYIKEAAMHAGKGIYANHETEEKANELFRRMAARLSLYYAKLSEL